MRIHAELHRESCEKESRGAPLDRPARREVRVEKEERRGDSGARQDEGAQRLAREVAELLKHAGEGVELEHRIEHAEDAARRDERAPPPSRKPVPGRGQRDREEREVRPRVRGEAPRGTDEPRVHRQEQRGLQAVEGAE